MKNKRYLICYDISDNKRLAKLARYLEKVAFRIQYSIFLLPSCSPSLLEEVSQSITDIIDIERDDVRIYTIKNSGYALGIATNLDEPFIIL